MAVTIEEIKKWLDKMEIHYSVDENDYPVVYFSMIINDNDDFFINIHIEREGELIQFYINQRIGEDKRFLRIKDHQHQLLIQKFLLARTYGTIFGSWDLDPEDGAITFSVKFPLEDAPMTERQFNSILDRLYSVDKEFIQLHKILETGEYPPNDDWMDTSIQEDTKTDNILDSINESLEEISPPLDISNLKTILSYAIIDTFQSILVNVNIDSYKFETADGLKSDICTYLQVGLEIKNTKGVVGLIDFYLPAQMAGYLEYKLIGEIGTLKDKFDAENIDCSQVLIGTVGSCFTEVYNEKLELSLPATVKYAVEYLPKSSPNNLYIFQFVSNNNENYHFYISFENIILESFLDEEIDDIDGI